MLVNKKMVRKNKALRAAQRSDKKLNRDRKLERGSILKKNIEKVVSLSSEAPLNPSAAGAAVSAPFSAQELIERVEAAGLTGMSGSGFPTAEKLRSFLAGAESAGRRVIVINGIECEPGLINDAWLMRNKAAEIIDGAAALRQAFSPERMVLATRGRAEYLAGLESRGLEHARLPLKYPLGEEHLLIKQLLRLELQSGTLPAEQGVLVLNVQTVWQIGRILSGSYDGGHYVTLANLKTGEARVSYVHNGEGVAAALEQAFGAAEGDMYSGGGVGRADAADGSTVFTNTTSFAAYSGRVLISNQNPCRKCGGCTKRCPMGVRVKDIVLARQKNPGADISALGADKCIHCGTCTYFCMAGKNPMEYVAE